PPELRQVCGVVVPPGIGAAMVVAPRSVLAAANLGGRGHGRSVFCHSSREWCGVATQARYERGCGCWPCGGCGSGSTPGRGDVSGPVGAGGTSAGAAFGSGGMPGGCSSSGGVGRCLGSRNAGGAGGTGCPSGPRTGVSSITAGSYICCS